jgi:hypothetical protein
MRPHLLLTTVALLVLPSSCATRATEAPPAPEPEAAQSLDLRGSRPETALAAPEFKATNRDGAARAREHLIGQPTVLWFFPMAGTPG